MFQDSAERTQSSAPAAVYLATKTSNESLADTRVSPGPGSKSRPNEKLPVTYTFPPASVAVPNAWASALRAKPKAGGLPRTPASKVGLSWPTPRKNMLVVPPAYTSLSRVSSPPALRVVNV